VRSPRSDLNIFKWRWDWKRPLGGKKGVGPILWNFASTCHPFYVMVLLEQVVWIGCPTNAVF
jgi:hypothetical protein